MIGGFEQIVERRIREAIELGQFDRLPGMGRPLELEDEGPDHDEWLANKVLKNAGCLPPWVEIGKEIDALEDDLAALQGRHRRWVHDLLNALPASAAERSERRPGIEAIHHRFAQRYREGLEELKELIALHNRFAPSEQIHKPGFWLAARLERFDAAFRPLLAALGGELPDAEAVAAAVRESDERERRHAFYQRWKVLTAKLGRAEAHRQKQRRRRPA